jgi:hypothetical protein
MPPTGAKGKCIQEVGEYSVVHKRPHKADHTRALEPAPLLHTGYGGMVGQLGVPWEYVLACSGIVRLVFVQLQRRNVSN